MRAFLKTPKGALLVTLLLLAGIASCYQGASGGWINVAAAVTTAVTIDLAFALTERRNRIFPDGAVLTGLIVALVLSASAPWYTSAFTAALAILSKHLLKVKRRPIFNPAALGLAVAIPLFNTGQSWWGGLALIPWWSIPCLLIGGLFITGRVNKFPQVLSFLGVYTAAMLIGGLLQSGPAGDGLRDPFINSALFLAFFMVTDPPTSPARYKEQVIFGVLAAVICVLDYFVLGGLSYLLIGLLIANGYHAWRGWRTSAVHRRLASA
jgi:Na+-translocating ferredoxin:NAD+ oxidoreductase RnfD subunit